MANLSLCLTIKDELTARVSSSLVASAPPIGDFYVHAQTREILLPGVTMPNPKGSSPDFSDVRTGSSSAPAGMSPPRTDPQTAETYTVKSGDSLSKIAQQLYGDGRKWRAIFEANRDLITNPDLIHPGQVLKIPSIGDDTP